MRFELTDLVRLGETIIGPRCQEIHDLANTNVARLAALGTTATEITALQTAITDYSALVTKPREAIIEEKVATGDIAADENTANALLNDELDKAMKKFKTKEPAFFNEYTSARMIIDLGSRNQKPPTPPSPTPAPPTP